MKILFLDVDGVLNSALYDAERRSTPMGNVDETRLPLLRRIVDATGAVIVLSTSWRVYWDPDPTRCAPEWAEIGDPLTAFGLRVYDKTPSDPGNNRDCEVRDWLEAHKGEVESFAILDDMSFGWGDLALRLVRTNYHKGRGLEERHVEAAIRLLDTPLA